MTTLHTLDIESLGIKPGSHVLSWRLLQFWRIWPFREPGVCVHQAGGKKLPICIVCVG